MALNTSAPGTTFPWLLLILDALKNRTGLLRAGHLSAAATTLHARIIGSHVPIISCDLPIDSAIWTSRAAFSFGWRQRIVARHVALKIGLRNDARFASHHHTGRLRIRPFGAARMVCAIEVATLALFAAFVFRFGNQEMTAVGVGTTVIIAYHVSIFTYARVTFVFVYVFHPDRDTFVGARLF